MNSRTWILLGVAAVGVVLLTIGVMLLVVEPTQEVKTTASVSHPNVVLIVMDAFRADKVGAQRNNVPLTPFFDGLRDSAAVFNNALVPCTWTRPSMASLYTSMPAETHQIFFGVSPAGQETHFADTLSQDLPNIAGYLKKQGFSTLALQTNGVVSADFGFGRGFDAYVFYDAVPAQKTTDHALELLQEDTAPFFLYVHYMDPHTPYNPPEEHLDALGYDISQLPAHEQEIVADFTPYFWDHINHKLGIGEGRRYEELSAPARDAIMTRYDGEIRYTDEEVRRLVETIQRRFPNTLFIVTADHGEHFWEHDFLGHGLTLFNQELHVPLFIFGAGVSPRQSESPVSLIDIPPTIAGLLGLPPEPEWQGQTMFQGEARPVFAHTRGGNPTFNINLDAVVSDGMKLIVDNHNNTAALFDYFDDPLEKEDVLAAHPDVAARLREAIAQWRRNAMQARRTTREQTEIDPETIEQLKRLGYVE